jgi:hypothetical protein
MKPRRIFARVKKSRQPDGMNKTETAYEATLAAAKSAGEIANYWYEGIKLKINTACFYTPDFMVQANNGEIELHEVKGYKKRANGEHGWYGMDDAKVKVKAVAAMFPFAVVVVYQLPKKFGGDWKVETL